MTPGFEASLPLGFPRQPPDVDITLVQHTGNVEMAFPGSRCKTPVLQGNLRLKGRAAPGGLRAVRAFSPFSAG